MGEGGAAPPAPPTQPSVRVKMNPVRTVETRSGAAGGAAGEKPPRKRAKVDPVAAVVPVGRCTWYGKVCELLHHLNYDCQFELVKCPHVGCEEFVVRNGAAGHDPARCQFRVMACVDCNDSFEARYMLGHVVLCPRRKVKCPNRNCGEKVAREEMEDHRETCLLETVGCPCDLCEDEMLRRDVFQHIESSGFLHFSYLAEELEELHDANQRRRMTINRKFEWTTNAVLDDRESASSQFMSSVRGSCFNTKTDIGFRFEDGAGDYKIYFKCMLLDKNNSFIRFLGDLESCDFRDVASPPMLQTPRGVGWGNAFALTAADRERAQREDGSIKFQMEVFVQLPENFPNANALRQIWGTALSVVFFENVLRRREQALTHMFTWSTDSECVDGESPTATFVDGVSGCCFNYKQDYDRSTHLVGFHLETGPDCTFDMTVSIIGKDDKVLRVVSDEYCDGFQRPPRRVSTEGEVDSVGYRLTAADKAGAVRADGSIKLRTVVYLYLPE